MPIDEDSEFTPRADCTPTPDGSVGFGIRSSDGSYGGLIRDVIRPLFDALAEADPGSGWFFIRDWHGQSPSVFLFGRDVNPRTADHLPELVRSLHDRVEITPTGELAGLEGVASGPWGRPLVERMLIDASRGLADLIAEYGDDRREQLALDLMVGHLPAVHIGAVGTEIAPRGLPLSYLSYRYHADGFFLMCSNSTQMREEMEERYLATRDVISERVRTVLAELSAGQCPPESPAGWWMPLARSHLPTAIEGFRRGLITNGSTNLRQGWLGDTNDLSDSPLHQVIQGSRGYQDFLKVDPVFQGIRLLTAVVYFMVHTTGLRLIQRYFLCHAISRAIEDLFEIESADLVERIASERFADGVPEPAFEELIAAAGAGASRPTSTFFLDASLSKLPPGTESAPPFQKART